MPDRWDIRSYGAALERIVGLDLALGVLDRCAMQSLIG